MLRRSIVLLLPLVAACRGVTPLPAAPPPSAPAPPMAAPEAPPPPFELPAEAPADAAPSASGLHASPCAGPSDDAASPIGCEGEPDVESDGPDEDLDDDDALAAHPSVVRLADDEIITKYKSDRASLGPASIGRPNAGALVNGVQMPDDTRWIVRTPPDAYGTKETVDSLARCIERVATEHPGGAPVVIGHISAKHGGHLSPHRSHQAGRDVDIGYYHNAAIRDFTRGDNGTLDVVRSYALVKALVEDGGVEMIFMDHAIQRRMVAYAEEQHEDPAFLDRVFQVRGKSSAPIVRHWSGHRDHFHVRFVSPAARELGRRLVALALLSPPAPSRKKPSHGGSHEDAAITYVNHRARSGDTLVVLARRYGTTIEAIQKANDLRSIALKAGHTYRIPVKRAATSAKGGASARGQKRGK